MQPRHLLPAAAALVLPVCLLWELPAVKGYIHAVSDHNTSMEFSDLPAIFGYPLSRQGLVGLLVEARPANACLPLEAPPSNSSVFIALVRRYNCSFDVKVYHAQQAGFLAVIVHNVGSDDLLNMVWEDDQLRRRITVPSVFTGETAATYLRSLFTYEKGGHVVLIPEYIFPLGYYLIPFTGVVGVVIAVMCAILIVRCMQHRKRMRKDRLSKEQLKKIPSSREAPPDLGPVRRGSGRAAAAAPRPSAGEVGPAGRGGSGAALCLSGRGPRRRAAGRKRRPPSAAQLLPYKAGRAALWQLRRGALRPLPFAGAASRPARLPVFVARRFARPRDEYDVCAICLEEYEDGDRLRILPCSHAYHCKCVDPWLTQTKKTCPVCKQRVIRSPEDSDSEGEEGTDPTVPGQSEGGAPDLGQEEEEDSERTPLLRPSPSTAVAPPCFGSMARSVPSSPQGLLAEGGEEPPPSPPSQSQLLV